jgi:hypothetical protein
MKVSMEGAIRLANDRIWFVGVEPRDLRYLGACQNSIGEISVVLVANPIYKESQKRLEFEPSSARLLNIGNSTKTIIIGIGIETEISIPDKFPETQLKPGDANFIKELKEKISNLASLGEKLLAEVRRYNPVGELNREGKRFVERPDNFWTVTIQPRKRALFITVRGRPERFSGVFSGDSGIEPKKDRPGHTGFAINDDKQLDDAFKIIRHAKRQRY